jgi:hypothetical protein
MAKSTKRARPFTTFKHTVPIEVRRAEFELLASVALLDGAKLARAARAKIELGYFKTDCCRNLVRAIVEKGMVVKLTVEPCSDHKSRPASAELVRLLDLARQHVTPPNGRPFSHPVPVAEFMREAGDITIQTITCVQICIFGRCWVCCSSPFGPEWNCGDTLIIHTGP